MSDKIQERRAKGLFWDKAWKLVEGCTKVSPGCDNCWSERETHMRCFNPNVKIQQRANAVMSFDEEAFEPYKFKGKILLRHDNLDLPLRTRKPTVFSIWNDLFHEDVPLSFVCDAIQVMERAKKFGHTFLVLTKRANRMGNFYHEVGEVIPDHVWHGVTVCNQEEADKNIPLLLQVPGNRFLSIEPMLGPVNLVRAVRQNFPSNREIVYIKQVLLGGESGPGARPLHPDWVRAVRDQCAAAAVPFYFKQWGEYQHWTGGPISVVGGHEEGFKRVGKKKAGRELDGQLHDTLAWGE